MKHHKKLKFNIDGLVDGKIAYPVGIHWVPEAKGSANHWIRRGAVEVEDAQEAQVETPLETPQVEVETPLETPQVEVETPLETPEAYDRILALDALSGDYDGDSKEVAKEVTQKENKSKKQNKPNQK